MKLKIINKKTVILLSIILTLAFLPRVLQVLNASNYFFGYEQGVEYLVTKQIVVDHQFILKAHQGGFGGFFKPPGFNYLLAIPFILFNGDPFGGRLMMFAISLASVAGTFLILLKFKGVKPALFTSFLVAVSPSLKDYAGGISPPFVIPFLTVIYIYLFSLLKKNDKYFTFLFFILGIMANFEMATAIILFAYTFILLLADFKRKIIPVRLFLTSFTAFLIPFFTLVIYDFNNNFYNTKGVLGMVESILNFKNKDQSGSYISVVLERTSVFGWNFISTFSPQLLIWFPILITSVIFILRFLRNKKSKPEEKRFIYFLSGIPIFSFVFLLLYPGNIAQWWLIHLSIVYCFIFGFVINNLWDNKKTRSFAALLMIILSLAFVNRTVFTYKTQFSLSVSTFIKENVVIEKIFQDGNSSKYGIVVISKTRQENYDYLIWWNGQKNNYAPFRERKGIYYVIKEPGAIEKEKETNKLINTFNFSNGFKIEKRSEI